MTVFNEKRCKVCNSQLRTKIERLHVDASLSPERIYDWLTSSATQDEQNIATSEGLSPSAIRRHITRHFNVEDGSKIKLAQTRTRLEESRKSFESGVQMTVDRIGYLNHMLEMTMINIQEVETTQTNSKKHQQIIQYMNSAKGLIETLSKLTGDLKQEGAIDINFFNDEITTFAEIVMRSIRSIDFELQLNGSLEGAFSTEFEKQWIAYQERRDKIVNGELSVNDGANHKNVNTFNEGG